MYLAVYGQFLFNIFVSCFLLMQVYNNYRTAKQLDATIETLEEEITERFEKIEAESSKQRLFVRAIFNEYFDRQFNKKQATK